MRAFCGWMVGARNQRTAMRSMGRAPKGIMYSCDKGRNARCYYAEHERRRVQVVALCGVELRGKEARIVMATEVCV